MLKIDATTSTLVADKAVVDGIAGVLVVLPGAQTQQLLASFREALGGKASRDTKLLFFRPPSSASIDNVIGLSQSDAKALPCVPMSLLNSSSVASLFTSALQTDRTDGLFTTIVASSTNDPLGLVYSSTASLAMSIQTGHATYYSRSRNSLWKKGETSGATQNVDRIRIDCDGDALQFQVEQKAGTGFCQSVYRFLKFGETTHELIHITLGCFVALFAPPPALGQPPVYQRLKTRSNLGSTRLQKAHTQLACCPIPSCSMPRSGKRQTSYARPREKSTLLLKQRTSCILHWSAVRPMESLSQTFRPCSTNVQAKSPVDRAMQRQPISCLSRALLLPLNPRRMDMFQKQNDKKR